MAYNAMPEFKSNEGKPLGYEHRRIHHASKVYVVGDIHTNTVEGFWSLLKRGIGGVYHAVSQKYWQTYLDEYSYRYNRRDHGNLIFKSILNEVSKLSYVHLGLGNLQRTASALAAQDRGGLRRSCCSGFAPRSGKTLASWHALAQAISAAFSPCHRSFPPGHGQARRDPQMSSTLAGYDIALLDTSEVATSNITPEGLYAVDRGGEVILRYLRPGTESYYLVSDATLNTPADWEQLKLSKRDLVEMVKARVRWLGREKDRDLPAPQRGRFLYDAISS